MGESICTELIRASHCRAPSEPHPAATEREKEAEGKQNDAGARSARSDVINKAEIRTDTNGKIEDQVCVICCVRKTNAVFMPCCHGGLCFECAIKISKQKAICHFCRKDVLQVLQIDLDEHSDFFRISDKHDVVLTTKIITKP